MKPDAPATDVVERFKAEAMPLMPVLLRVALMLTHREHTAEDLVQEAMLRAFRHINSFRPGTNMKAWLMTILRRVHIDRYRRESVRIAAGSLKGFEPAAESATAVDSWDGVDPNQILEQIDDEAIGSALLALSESMRWVLLLVDVEQMSVEEVAVVLDIPAGTVKSRASRARAVLRDLLEPVARERGWVA